MKKKEILCLGGGYYVFLLGESMLVYRVFRNERKKFSKTLHVCLHSMVLVFMIIALKAVWDSHDLHRDALGIVMVISTICSLFLRNVSIIFLRSSLQ
ncbi:hypothetical protein COOONC_24943 [Cooperia oncophora]